MGPPADGYVGRRPYFRWRRVPIFIGALQKSRTPEDLVAKIAEDQTFLERLNCVITDMNFEGSAEDGVSVAKMIKHLRSTLPVLLCTDADYDLPGSGSLIDQVIAKEPIKYGALSLFH